MGWIGEAAMKGKIAIVMVVFGACLAVYGIFDYQGAVGILPAGWTPGDRIEIALGVGLFILGLLLRRDSRKSSSDEPRV